MLQEESFFETHDGTKLFLYRWKPENQSPKAVLHIVHGMAEYALRYKRLAEKLSEAGIEVWAGDQRGHGKTADLTINKPDKGGLLGHCASSKCCSKIKSYTLVTSDIHEINKKIKETFQAPLFLMGHSWGSFIVQNYIEEYSKGEGRREKVEGEREQGTGNREQITENSLIQGCILSGTKGPGDFLIKIGKPFLTILAFFKGQINGSNLARAMGDGQYNKPFSPNRTPFDWLSRDEAEVDKYDNDAYCGFLCSSGFYRDLTGLLNVIHKKKNLLKINKNLPMYVFSGSSDPVGNMGDGVAALVRAYRKLEIKDCEFVLYPGARHETLNETNREEVMDNLLAWINKHC